MFLLLAVPFGEALIDPLINVTADFTVAALQATGIPVLRNGTHFEIPSGSWSVVEACSGVRYLISSFTLGCLYANLTYRSRVRQAIFIVLSIIVPIIANGLRAYMIVMIGHLSGMELAVGVDHLIYGWLFFGLVMFIMLWVGSFWREDLDDAPATGTRGTEKIQGRRASTGTLLTAAVAAIACLAVWPAYSGYVDRVSFNPAPVELGGFQGRWQEVPTFTDWTPNLSPASKELRRLYKRDDQHVGMFVAYYRNQHDGAKLISTSNLLVPRKSSSWRKVSTIAHVETIADRPFAVRESKIQGAAGPLLVWHWYWIGGQFTANDYVGKLLQAKEKFLMHGDDGASLITFAPYTSNPGEARLAMQRFLSDNLTSLEETLAGNQLQQRRQSP
jgi:EpsI family protein